GIVTHDAGGAEVANAIAIRSDPADPNTVTYAVAGSQSPPIVTTDSAFMVGRLTMGGPPAAPRPNLVVTISGPAAFDLDGSLNFGSGPVEIVVVNSGPVAANGVSLQITAHTRETGINDEIWTSDKGGCVAPVAAGLVLCNLGKLD